MTQVEKARLEALATFGGTDLNSVMDSSKRRVARLLGGKKEEGKEEEDGEREADEKENVLAH